MELHAILNAVLNFFNSVPSEAWGMLIEVVVASFAVSPIMVAVKKWFAVDSEKKMMGLVILGSMFASVGLYLRGVPEFSPWFVAVQGMLVFACTQPVYYLFIKPLFRKLGATVTIQIQKAKGYNEARSAIVPAGGLPLNTPQDDFQN